MGGKPTRNTEGCLGKPEPPSQSKAKRTTPIDEEAASLRSAGSGGRLSPHEHVCKLRRFQQSGEFDLEKELCHTARGIIYDAP